MEIGKISELIFEIWFMSLWEQDTYLSFLAQMSAKVMTPSLYPMKFLRKN